MTTLHRSPGPLATTIERRSDTYDHLAPVLAEFIALPTDAPGRRPLRDQLVEGFLPVVQHIASRYRNRGEPLDDLEQVGTIGLVRAIDRFEPERGLNSLTYAIPTITGEIRRHFRDRTWTVNVPRPMKDLQQPVRNAVAELSDELRRAPRPREIAARLALPSSRSSKPCRPRTPTTRPPWTPVGRR